MWNFYLILHKTKIKKKIMFKENLLLNLCCKREAVNNRSISCIITVIYYETYICNNNYYNLLSILFKVKMLVTTSVLLLV